MKKGNYCWLAEARTGWYGGDLTMAEVKAADCTIFLAFAWLEEHHHGSQEDAKAIVDASNGKGVHDFHTHSISDKIRDQT